MGWEGATRLAPGLIVAVVLATGCAVPWPSDRNDEENASGPPKTGLAAASGTEGRAAGDALDSETRQATEAAVARLEEMAGWLASQRSFRLRAEVSYDAVQPTGERIEFGGVREVVVERPDRLRFDVIDRDGDREILAYDGREVWLASPSLRAFARAPQTGPVDVVIERLAELDSPLPLADLVDPGLGARLRPLVRSAARVGLVRLDGRVCEQFAYRTDHIDFQLFIEPGDAPIPRRMVVDYLDEPARPQFRASFREWDFAQATRPAAFFQIQPPIGAQRVGLAELVEWMRDEDGLAASDGASE